jgi:hypothetical protein
VQYHAYRTEAYRSEGLGSYVRTDVGSRTARLAATRLMSFFLTLLSASLPSSLPQALVTFSANSQYPHPGSRRLALGSTTLLPSTPPPRTEHGPLSPFSASTSCLSSSILVAKRRRSRSRTSSRKPSKEHTSKYPKHTGESRVKGGGKSKVDNRIKISEGRRKSRSDSSSDEKFSPSSESGGEIEDMSEESASNDDELESDASISEPSTKHKHPPRKISITTDAKSSKRHRDPVSEKETPHFVYDGVRVSKADFEAFLRQNKTGHRGHLVDEDAGGSEGEMVEAEEEDPKWEMEIDLGELEESDDEEDLEELKDRA